MFIKIEIENCSGCPFMESKRVYTADSWEMPFEWKCTKANKVIAGFVEYYDKIKIPDWCPCRLDNYMIEFGNFAKSYQSSPKVKDAYDAFLEGKRLTTKKK